jgi:hypothetical protein
MDGGQGSARRRRSPDGQVSAFAQTSEESREGEGFRGFPVSAKIGSETFKRLKSFQSFQLVSQPFPSFYTSVIADLY